MSQLTSRGRTARVLCTFVGVLVLLAGTFWGQDDDFPFGPFRMYATAPDPDGDARDTRVEGIDATGRTVIITETNSGIRRAEIEGKQASYVAEPSRLQRIAEAYQKRTPGSPVLGEVRIVIRWYGVQDSRPTGTHRDEVVARWVRP
jgi:hypothetical protein